jgi:hypothetical protein
MFLEYARLLGLTGESPLNLGAMGRIVLIMLSAAGLLFVGYQIKGAWGAIIAIIIGILLFLYRQDLLSLL